MVQRNSGFGSAETGESITLRRIGKRKRLDSQRNFTPDNITLGAMSTGVKQYNVGLNRSIILARCGLHAEDGWCWWYRKYAPGDTVLEGMEPQAREDKKGLWADPHPAPPWECRKRVLPKGKG